MKLRLRMMQLFGIAVFDVWMLVEVMVWECVFWFVWGVTEEGDPHASSRHNSPLRGFEQSAGKRSPRIPDLSGQLSEGGSLGP